MKPKLRQLAAIEIRASLIGLLFKQIEKPETYPYQSCLNCFFFNEKEELCNKYKMRPPARIIAFGCPDYSDVIEIPF